jgi:hypothetical protein
MATAPALTGLCVTCKNGPFCTLSYRSPTPVWQCNEFEIIEYVPPRASRKTDSEPRMRDARQDREAEESGSYQGLCVNCELRATCRYAKSPGGVWHCNEYQ